jgi:rhodanese-related sulfurtransferase
MYMNIKEINAPDLAERLNDPASRPIVVDVRQTNEVMAGTVPGAWSVPLHTLPLKFNELDRDATHVIVCRSGQRSAQAVAYLQQQGYANVYNLRGGMIAWANGGLPVGQPQ